MNRPLVLQVVGRLLLLLALLMVPPLGVAWFYGQGDAAAFLYTLLAILACGLPLALLPKPETRDLNARDGFVAVGAAWVLLSLFGALPYQFSGTTPTFWDALFESVSGLTTTGASILAQVETLPHGVLFWRSYSLWVGGMGVLMLTIAVMPNVSGHNAHLISAESPGPSYTKLMPRMADTARMLYGIYVALTMLLTLLLVLTGMPVFDALIHALGTAGTGGFSNKNLSMAAYANPWAEVLIMVFMFLFGTNFLVFFRLLHGWGRNALRNDELIAYYALGLGATLLIAVDILPMYGDVWTALRHSGFQVSSIMSTTAYATVDFNAWPSFARSVLLLLMLIGGSAGSTAGGIKVVRLVLMGRAVSREVHHTLNPRSVKVIRLNGQTVPEETVRRVGIYLFVYFGLLMGGTLLASLDGHDFLSCFSATASCLSNIGPGLSLVGPMGNFGMFSPGVKVLMSVLMLLGRLEFFPMLVLFSPAVWRGGRRH